jgi:catechol 2,3-dioxygenase-like lactoylglutathione lyase family enzyme
MITRTNFVLAVPDLERSIAFYRDVLGFSPKEMGPGWKWMEKDNCRLMLGECPDATPPRDLGDHSWYGYWQVDDVDSYYARLKANGCEFIKDLRNESWGMREFGIRTIDGHRLMIGQQIKAENE